MDNIEKEMCQAYREGFQRQMKTMEKDICSLWKRWDKVIGLLIANLSGLIIAIISVWLTRPGS